MMKKWIALCLCLLTLSLPADARKRKKTEKQPAPTETTWQGLFAVTKSGDDWFFELPDSLLGRRILATVRYTATPAATSMYGGELAGQQTVYWEEAPGDRLLLRADMTVNVAGPADAINRAVVISNENPIIGRFKTEGRSGGRRKIKVTQLFDGDGGALGLPRTVKERLGLTSLISADSYIESIKTFPMNTEVRTVKTYASNSPKTVAGRATGRVTVGLNVSFVLLPEVPMQRRLFDPRVGYFADQFYYYSDHQQQVEDKRFIVRWRLEPKDSADAERMRRGELVEPKKPIVYYIDPATPPQWRPYLIAGVNDWQKAFERAGFKNAIMAKEWPENDSTMSMEDARYSVIRYLASPIPNAYGPQVHDPRSGEIIESHICWYHNVMTLVHDWYMIQAGTLDEAARKMHYDEELMGQLIRFVSSHEVGHTLGLRHNFGASSTVPVDSLRSKSWVEKHGHTPSIMDYARFNYVAQPEDSISRKGIFPRIGDYDLWAIEWGYRPMLDAYDDESDRYELEKLIGDRLRRQPRLWFGDGETNVTNDPRCQTEDLGDDAVKASELGLLNLKREIAALPRWTFEANDPEGEGLRRMYGQIETQFLRYAGHVMANIGGIYANYKTASEPGAIYTDTPPGAPGGSFGLSRSERAARTHLAHRHGVCQTALSQPFGPHGAHRTQPRGPHAFGRKAVGAHTYLSGGQLSRRSADPPLRRSGLGTPREPLPPRFAGAGRCHAHRRGGRALHSLDAAGPRAGCPARAGEKARRRTSRRPRHAGPLFCPEPQHRPSFRRNEMRSNASQTAIQKTDLHDI